MKLARYILGACMLAFLSVPAQLAAQNSDGPARPRRFRFMAFVDAAPYGTVATKEKIYDGRPDETVWRKSLTRDLDVSFGLQNRKRSIYLGVGGAATDLKDLDVRLYQCFLDSRFFYVMGKSRPFFQARAGMTYQHKRGTGFNGMAGIGYQFDIVGNFGIGIGLKATWYAVNPKNDCWGAWPFVEIHF